MDATAHPTPVQRLRPTGRHVEVPEGHRGLVVREGRPERTVPPGRQRIRGLLEPRPEIYIYPEEAFPLFLHLEDLHDAEGRPLHLSWKLRVRVDDPSTYWAEWLNLHPQDQIPGPDELIAARIADPIQQEVARYALEDLRTDPEIRYRVGMTVLRHTQQELRRLGLTVAQEPDPQRMRFYTAQERLAAEQERELLAGMRADERLQRTIRQLEDVDTLSHYLVEWLQDHGRQADPDTVMQLAEAILRGRMEPSVADLQTATVPPSLGGPMDIDPETLDELVDGRHGRGFTHLRYHFGQMILLAGTLAALVLAGVWIFRPEMFWDNERPHLVVGLVVGIALGGLLVAWFADRLIRRHARRTAQRLLAEIDPAVDEAEDLDRMEMRHVLMLLGAFLAVAAAGVALWFPDYYPWVRFGGAVVTLVAAALAIRYDWIRTMEHAVETVARAQRRVAGARLNALQYRRLHRRLQADLAAQAGALREVLHQAREYAFRAWRDRSMYRTVDGLIRRLDTLAPRLEELAPAAPLRRLEDPQTVETYDAALQDEMQRCADLAQALYGHMLQGEKERAAEALQELERRLTGLQALLARRQAVTV